MEFAAYLNNALVYEQSQQGREGDRPLDCALAKTITKPFARSFTTSFQAKSFQDFQAKVKAKVKSTVKSTVGGSAKYTLSATLVASTIVGGITILPAAAQTPEIVLLQDLLARKGFDPGEVDGVKGAATEAAIIQAQNFYGLEADGIVGAQTLEALQSDPYPNGATDNSTASSESVVNLQKLLADRGFYHSDIDGISGSQTEAAILSAQNFYGLTQDGIAGPATIAALEADSGTPTKPVSDNSDVTSLQKLLAARGFYGGEIDGISGSETEAAILSAQKFYGLAQDGVAGSATIAALEADKGGISTLPAPKPISVNDVAYVQQLLATQGFYSGAIDGILGSQTEAAIITAQKFYRLVPDGIAGSATIAALQNGNFTSVKPPSNPASNEVANLQNLLRDRGFYVGAIDGIFGTSTSQAIASAQRYYGLPVTGTTNPAIVAALEGSTINRPISYNGSYNGSPNYNNSPVVISTGNSVTSPVIATGNIADLQKLLSQRGFYTGTINGSLGQETKNAIIRAQNFYGLTPADGSPNSRLTDNLNRDPYVASSVRS
jgi:peptidoglycan hydrolase-like protein with peptidoglycan-binding domain